jgi:hypothetical protein
MGEAAVLIQHDLESRHEQAVLDAMRRLTKLSARRIGVEEQERHTERMVTCHHTLLGTGWFGSLLLMMPHAGANWIAGSMKGLRPGEKMKGPDLADVLGTLGATIAIDFGGSFAPDQHFTVGMPTVITGSDVAVSFPWGNHFECRLCFSTSQTPFWSILRISKRGEGDDF